MWIQYALVFFLASLSLVSAALAIWCYVRVAKLLHGASLRQLAQLSNEVTELTSCFESLAGSLKRVAARTSMRELRERRRSSLESTEPEAPVGEQKLPREQLKEIARARGFKLS